MEETHKGGLKCARARGPEPRGRGSGCERACACGAGPERARAKLRSARLLCAQRLGMLGGGA